jgi:hypothetical protein
MMELDKILEYSDNEISRMGFFPPTDQEVADIIKSLDLGVVMSSQAAYQQTPGCQCNSAESGVCQSIPPSLI